VVYPLVLVFQPGAIAEIVGKYPAPVYWIIKTPTNETCWLWGEYATVEGDTSTLPDMAAPPAPVAAPTEVPEEGGEAGSGIAAPGNFSATATCQILDMGGGNKILQGKMDMLSWTQVAGATGYKIFIDGAQFQIVGSNAASFNINALAENPANYGIAAFDNETTSTVVTIPEPNCP